MYMSCSPFLEYQEQDKGVPCAKHAYRRKTRNLERNRKRIQEDTEKNEMNAIESQPIILYK